MFKKFTIKEDVSQHTQVKTSVARKIIKALVTQYPTLANQVEFIFPKKAAIYTSKVPGYIGLVSCQEFIWFFSTRDGGYVPTLRTLHMYPDLLPHIQVDKGAVPFVLRGVNMMAPGLLNSKVGCPEGLEEGQVVAIMADNKQRACGIGRMLMSTAKIQEEKNGVAVEMIHHMGDGLWDETKEDQAQLIKDGLYAEEAEDNEEEEQQPPPAESKQPDAVIDDEGLQPQEQS